MVGKSGYFVKAVFEREIIRSSVEDNLIDLLCETAWKNKLQVYTESINDTEIQISIHFLVCEFYKINMRYW